MENLEKCSSSALLVPQETSWSSHSYRRPVVKQLWKHARCWKEREKGDWERGEVNGKKFLVRRRGRKVSPKELFAHEKNAASRRACARS